MYGKLKLYTVGRAKGILILPLYGFAGNFGPWTVICETLQWIRSSWCVSFMLLDWVPEMYCKVIVNTSAAREFRLRERCEVYYEKFRLKLYEIWRRK